MNPEIQNMIGKAEAMDSTIFKFYKIHGHKVGPHFLPMIELHFSEKTKSEVISWLEANRNDLSVLIHEDTGDDVRDHLAPIWLGEKYPIDFTFFEKVHRDSSLSIH